MSHHSNYKEHRKAIFDELILSGHTKNYIRRALKVYERNYGLNYNIEVIAEIVRRLQKKDRNKARQKRRNHHPKSQSETFDLKRSFTPQKSKKQSKQTSGKITPFDTDDAVNGFGMNIEANTNAKTKQNEDDEPPPNELNRMHIKSSRSLNSKEFHVDTHGISSSNKNHIRSKSSMRRSVDDNHHHIKNGYLQLHSPYKKEDTKMNQWIDVLKRCKSARDVLDNDLLMYLHEMKEYFLSNPHPNWDYFVRNNVLSVLCDFICGILSPKYVKIWHPLVSIALDIVCVLMDYYLRSKILRENDNHIQLIRCIIEIESFASVLLDYNVSILMCCCSILGKLTFENEENIDCVVNMNGIEHILNMIGKCKGNVNCNPLIISCLNLLCVLCYNSDFNKEYICDNGGCAMIIDLLSYFISLKYHQMAAHDAVIMMNSILRTLGNFTFGCSGGIASLLSCELMSILSSLISQMNGSDSNMLVLLMQIVSDIASTGAVEPWIIESMLAISRKNRSCLLLQECMLNGIAILVSGENTCANSAILIENGGEVEIFVVMKQLNYPQHVVHLALRVIRTMCGASASIASHLVKQSNLFNFLTHIMKHWRLKQPSEDIMRIECCCKVIRLCATKVSKFSKYGNKCHVMSGLIKILMLNDDGQYKLSPILWCECVRTFIAICQDEENCIKLAKHGTKCVLNAIAIYDEEEIIRNISILLCGISRYESVCGVLYSLHSCVVIDIAYHLLAENTSNVFICNQLILFLSNMLISVCQVYHMLETKLKCQSLINKILYLHSNYDPLIKTCHHYHKSIEIWLQKNVAMPSKPQYNPYNIGDVLQYKTHENEWIECRVIETDDNWIVIRGGNQNGGEIDRKLEVMKHEQRLRRFISSDADEDDDELHMFLNEIRRFNWEFVCRNSLFECVSHELIIDAKRIANEVAAYRHKENSFFGHLLYRSSNRISRDYVTLIALSELYCVRIRVFELNKEDKLSILFDIGAVYDLDLPCICLAFVSCNYLLIHDAKQQQQSMTPHDDDNRIRCALKEYRFFKFYAKLFSYFDASSCGQLRGAQIYDFFVSSTLCTDVLRTIWDESVGDNCPTMNVKQFICAMQLILAEQGRRRAISRAPSHHTSPLSTKKRSKKFEKSNTKSKICVKKEDAICGGGDLLSRNSANDADDCFGDHLIAAGVAMMSYPIHCNPFDLNQLLLQSIRDESQSYSSNEIRTNDIDNTTATDNTKHKKSDEFIRFFNQIKFGSAASADAYYDKIAEFEYNDIEKMMQLDMNILIHDVQMNENDARHFHNKLHHFCKMNRRFEKWLINQCRMRRYAVKFSNEGILTFNILRQRCKTIRDLIQIIGQKNKNDARILWRKIPQNCN